MHGEQKIKDFYAQNNMLYKILAFPSSLQLLWEEIFFASVNLSFLFS